jgi:hypothetical protein
MGEPHRKRLGNVHGLATHGDRTKEGNRDSVITGNSEAVIEATIIFSTGRFVNVPMDGLRLENGRHGFNMLMICSWI